MKKSLLFILSLSSLALLGCGEEETRTSSNIDEETSSFTISQAEAKFSFLTKSVSVMEDSLTKIEFESSGRPKFVSSSPNVAELNSNGKLIAKSAGKTTIIGSVGSISDILEVIVTSKSSSSSLSIKLEKSSEYFSLEKGSTYQIQPSLFENEEKVNNPVFTYSSSNEDIASVSSDGTVTLKKEGMASIEVKYGDLSAYFQADVYTKFIESTTSWLEMIATDSKYDERYCLTSDLDFSGVAYKGYPRLGYPEDNLKAFSGEINGRGYSLFNITMADQGDFHQSLFGKIRAATIRNIAFENVTFTDTNGGRLAGLAGYACNDTEREITTPIPNKIENVLLDLTFPETKGKCAGLFSNGYQFAASNIFLYMKKSNNTNFDKTKDSIFNENEYFWYGNGTISNSSFCSEGSLLPHTVGTENYGQSSLNQVAVSSSLMDAYKGCYDYLDKNVWKLHPDSNPELIKQ